ncbi:MAG: hypothetical protein HBSIN02_10810 [Bacteroidia bacterium]|nr:MAG: hypothetical protein HBSIN02_10810 [Bacteroidia bacterium]
MNGLSKQELRELLSLAVDGELDAERQKALDEYCSSHPEAMRELQELRRLKTLMRARGTIAPNPFFWTRLSRSLEKSAEESENLLPFPSKFLPAASAIAIVTFIGIGITVFLQRGPLLQFISETSTEVQHAYENSILKGSILPLFANIGNDEVLQYALFGTLPLDKGSDAALRVDEASAEGYKIEVGLKAEKLNRPAVTVKDLYAEVKPTKVQAVRIDSVLKSAREKIARAGFYAENNALAIDPEITQLNRRVLSRIVGVLGPAQRKRLDRFLRERRAAYTVDFDEPHPTELPPAVPRHASVSDRPRDYIVITPDSFAVATLAFDVDSLHGQWSVQIQSNMVQMHRKLEEFVRAQARRAPIIPERTEAPVRVVGEGDVMSIEIGRIFVDEERNLPRLVVAPRGRGETFFRFEMRTGTVSGDSDRLNIHPELDIEAQVRTQMDSMVKHLERMQDRQLRELRTRDSLRALREAAHRRAVIADSLR